MSFKPEFEPIDQIQPASSRPVLPPIRRGKRPPKYNFSGYKVGEWGFFALYLEFSSQTIQLKRIDELFYMLSARINTALYRLRWQRNEAGEFPYAGWVFRARTIHGFQDPVVRSGLKTDGIHVERWPDALPQTVAWRVEAYRNRRQDRFAGLVQKAAEEIEGRPDEQNDDPEPVGTCDENGRPVWPDWYKPKS